MTQADKLLKAWKSRIEDLAHEAADYYVEASDEDLDYIENQGFAVLFEMVDDAEYTKILDADDEEDTLFYELYYLTQDLIDEKM